jgi:hypothetical protein
MLVIPALAKLRREDLEVKANLCKTVKKKKKKGTQGGI